MKRLALVVAVVMTVTTCARFTGSPSSETPVILISIDTLRSDRLPAYGYDRVSTPHLDALRADSILYERAYSHCPLTLPSHATMFTGLLPSANGVRDNVGYRIDDKAPTLAELLKKNGYATGGAISAFVLRRESGMGRGFDFYDDDVEALGKGEVIGHVQRAGSETVAAAEQWLDKVQQHPFFLFVHLYEPHTPYTPPEPYRSQYKSAYDGEIAHVDRIVGNFLDSLKRRGLYDKALIVLTSDHGEGLNDHGEEEHGIFLYREALQVPLMVKLPKSRKGGESVQAPVQLVDVFTTILEQTATPAVEHDPGARSLVAMTGDAAATKRAIYAESYYPRLHFGWSDLHSLIDGDRHFIRAPIPELYDLGSDPAEKKNLLPGERRSYVQMRTAIEPYVKAASAPAAVDPEEAAKLAALGYVGSSVSTAAGDGELPDPKSTVHVFQQIRQAYTHFRDERFEEALALTGQLLRDNDKIVDIWDLRSKILVKMGRTRDAIAAAREGLKRQPNAVSLLMTVANHSIAVKDLEQAQAHAELLLKYEPSRAHEILARVAVERGDYKRAREEAQASVKNSHDPTPGYLTLGLIAKKENDFPAALRYLDEAAKVVARHKKPLATLHFNRGDVLARLGRNAEAEQEFRKEIAAYPGNPEPYSSLILLLSTQGRTDEATQLVYELVRRAPDAASYVTISETLEAIGDDRGAVYWARQGLKKFPADPDLKQMAVR
ncbi:MAG TPA: sulfatase-like hydrolase/transferase [Thermoanaerobaculia bacterium]|nr:sulfatase-like hydrolase/transferase [Thermoanaerobaculia bacterium]